MGLGGMLRALGDRHACVLRFVLGLRPMTLSTQPLKVAQRVIVAGNDVVALGTHAVAAGLVHGGLALTVCSCLDLCSALGPVTW